MLPLKIGFSRDTSPVPKTSLRGTFSGVCAPALMHNKVVKSWFPEGSSLQLDPAHGDEKYPVLFLMGYQREVRNVAFGLRFDYGFGREYPELLMILPDLILPGRDLPRVSMYAQLYLTSFWSTLLGRFLYGFSKHVARIDARDEQFVIHSRGGDKLYEADMQADDAEPCPLDAPSLEAVIRWFAQPVYSFNRGRESFADARYDFGTQPLPPMKAAARLFKGLCSRSSGQKFAAEGLRPDRLGAFQFSASWIFSSLTIPQLTEQRRAA